MLFTIPIGCNFSHLFKNLTKVLIFFHNSQNYNLKAYNETKFISLTLPTTARYCIYSCFYKLAEYYIYISRWKIFFISKIILYLHINFI